MTDERAKLHSSHWGAFTARMHGGRLSVEPFSLDPAPSELLANVPAALDHPARLSRPLIRRGWLQDGPGPDPRRGSDDYLEVEWDLALDLAAAELSRLGAGPAKNRDGIPGEKVYGGSYGWASAGRFHHAQSQVHRFLNTVFGGYVGSSETYSSAAGTVILSMVLDDAPRLTRDHPYLDDLAKNTELLISFGGLPLRNAAVSGGGNTQHLLGQSLEKAAARGCRFMSVSPLPDDFPRIGRLQWLAPHPATDTALMLGMAYHLLDTDQVDRAFLNSHCIGFERFETYLRGDEDGIPKTADWAAEICGIPAETIREIADCAATRRTLINVTYSLQRAENGEQPVWMALVLAAMLPGAFRPGAGFCYGLGSIGNIGKAPIDIPLPTFPQGVSGVKDRIPVARIADLLLRPGESYRYRGQSRRYADIRLVYWAGGNPFHHHQDLARLRRAFTRPDTIILHDSVGTASARHADIVFPATITSEREDIGAGSNDPFVIAMEALVSPRGEARDDYEIFAALAGRLGCGAEFTEGRDTQGWLHHIYESMRRSLAESGHGIPDYDDFRQGGWIELPRRKPSGRIARFLADPQVSPLDTPSGRIEIFSEAVAATGLPGHPAWLPPCEWLGASLARRHPFQLIANQPVGRLHSQLDFGLASQRRKVAGREVLRISPRDAARLGLDAGATARIWNDRGSILASVQLLPDMPDSVVQIPTGAWYAPIDLPGVGPTCVNGNPNVLTADIPTSELSQGCAGQLCLVSVEAWNGPDPGSVMHEHLMPCGGRHERDQPQVFHAKPSHLASRSPGE